MITNCHFLNKDGTTDIDLNTDWYPFTKFDPTVMMSTTTDRDRMELPGVNPTQTIRRGLELHIEGDIFGDGITPYFTRRMDLIVAHFGDPNVPDTYSDRKLGTFFITFDGATEEYKTDMTISLFSAPLEALGPQRSEFAITYFSWTPYMIGVDTGDFYYIA